jgi:hypothetical protein
MSGVIRKKITRALRYDISIGASSLVAWKVPIPSGPDIAPSSLLMTWLINPHDLILVLIVYNPAIPPLPLYPWRRRQYADPKRWDKPKHYTAQQLRRPFKTR